MKMISSWQTRLKDGLRIKNKLLILLSLLLLVGCAHHVPDIYGSWLLNNGSVMQISKEDFYWYQDETKVSYYAGQYPEVLTKEEALEAITVPESNKEHLMQQHIYYLAVTYDEFVLNNQDLSSSLKSEKSEFAFQMNGINSLSIVNLNSNEEFSAIRQEE